jgi:hypothetical protein
MEYKDTPYFSVAHARDLHGLDHILYRLLEILPGFLSWFTIIGVVLLSYLKPVWAAVFIIFFDLYWLLKTTHLSIHHYYSWRRMKYSVKQDWYARMKNLHHEKVFHLILLPFYKEDRAVVEKTIEALRQSEYDTQKFLVVLASEERAGEEYHKVGREIVDKYKNFFGDMIMTIHPANVHGELAGKGSNISYASEQARLNILNVRDIDYENVLVSAFDIDTVVTPQYFACLTWHFLTHPTPQKVSFQPVPLYNNNIWEAPFISRVTAKTSTFWQMIQQERPEKLVTFSSHSIPFKPLYEIGYWQKNMISEDSRIYWNLFLANNGDYDVVPLSYPVSMDANLAPTFWKTFLNVYKQHRRWMWGVENIPYMIFGFIKNKSIPLKKKIRRTMIQLEGFWSLATNPLIILLLGWLPIIIGGSAFRSNILSYNLPIVTRNLMTLAMLGLVLSAIIDMSLLPPIPNNLKKRKRFRAVMVIQWILVPFTIIAFGALPGLDSQTRLMFGKYMDKFWVTPKGGDKKSHLEQDKNN